MITPATHAAISTAKKKWANGLCLQGITLAANVFNVSLASVMPTTVTHEGFALPSLLAPDFLCHGQLTTPIDSRPVKHEGPSRQRPPLLVVKRYETKLCKLAETY